MYVYTCDYVSAMHGDVCTLKVECLSASAKITHQCIDGKHKLLTIQDA